MIVQQKKVIDKPIWVLAAILAAAGFAGCTQLGYNLGSMLPPEIETVYIPVFVNETDEPLLEVEATRAAQEAIQVDGSLKIANEADADAVLRVNLIEYKIVPIAFREDKATAADEYRIYLTAGFAMTRKETEEVLAQSSRVLGESTFLLEGDLTSSKKLALPEAADDLAHDIVEQIVEHW